MADFAPTIPGQTPYARWHRYPDTGAPVDARGPGVPAHRWWGGLSEEAIYQDGKDRVGLGPIMPFCTVPPQLSQTVAISIGDVLQVTSGTWSHAKTLNYQWVRDGRPITHANDTSYTVTVDDANSVLACLVTGTNNHGHESQISNATDAVLSGPPSIVTLPVVTATGLGLDAILTVTTGVWQGNPTSFSYQWLRNGTAILGEMNATYVLTEEDDGAMMSCLVIAANNGGSTPTISNAVGPVDTVITVPGANFLTWHGQVLTWHGQNLEWPFINQPPAANPVDWNGQPVTWNSQEVVW